MSTTSTTLFLTTLVTGAYLFAMAIFGTNPFESTTVFMVCLSIALALSVLTVATLTAWFGPPKIEYVGRE